jgi:hypothetical protein
MSADPEWLEHSGGLPKRRISAKLFTFQPLDVPDQSIASTIELKNSRNLPTTQNQLSK